MKIEICSCCGREFDPMKEISAEGSVTMKDGSRRKGGCHRLDSFEPLFIALAGEVGR